jgi:hypothetical protein
VEPVTADERREIGRLLIAANRRIADADPLAEVETAGRRRRWRSTLSG